MKTKLFAIAAALLATFPLAAQELAKPAKEIPLYQGTPPGSENWNWTERFLPNNGKPMVQNVVHPVLQYYPADKSKAVNTAMIIAPGGGFRNLMMSYEGVDIARRMNQLGIDAFVLKYRLTYTNPEATKSPAVAASNPQAGQNVKALAVADGLRAVRLVRANAKEYGIRPDRIGMIGFSAGGVVILAAVAGPADSRPNFAAAIYAGDAGTTSPPEGAPPLFIAVSADDQAVGYQGSLDLFSAWRKANIPVELHVFQSGRHGFVQKGSGADHYLDRLEEWLKLNGLLVPALTYPM